MDLLQTLLVSSQGEIQPAYRTIDPESLGYISSQTKMAAFSSSPSQLLSNQGLSLSQGIPDRSKSPAALERPPSCGQPYGNENTMPKSDSLPALSGPTFELHHDNIEDNRDDFSDSVSPRLIPMEEWEKENPYVPKRKIIPATVAKSTGEWATKFQHRCDQYSVRPEFSYDEVSKGQFNATLNVSGRTFETQEPQPNKKHAKEEVCKLALAEMPPQEKMEGIQGVMKKSKKRKSEDAQLEPQEYRKSDRSEEWIGLLNTHFQQNNCRPLQWEDSKVEAARPGFISSLSLLERRGQPFTTDPEAPYVTKQDARSAVAQAAVLWLRGQGLLSETAEKNQRQTASEDSATNPDVGVSGKSLPEQVHYLVQQLDLKTPRFIMTPSALTAARQVEGGGLERSHVAGVYDVHFIFDERDCEAEELLRGKLGEVRGCLGKAKSKEASSERVIPILEKVKRKRLAAF